MDDEIFSELPNSEHLDWLVDSKSLTEKEIKNNEELLKIVFNHRILPAALAELHGYASFVIKTWNPIMTKEKATKLARMQLGNKYVYKKMKEHEDGRVRMYDMLKEKSAKFTRVSGLPVVGLIHNQEVYIRSWLLRKECFSSFFTGQIEHHEESGFLNLFESMAKKFGIKQGSRIQKIIDECNLFSNVIKHSNKKKINRLYKIFKAQYTFDDDDSIVLWRELFIKYVKAFELLWILIFTRLDKPVTLGGFYYQCIFYQGREVKIPVDLIEQIDELKNGLSIRINEFWQEMDEQYDIKTEPVKFD